MNRRGFLARALLAPLAAIFGIKAIAKEPAPEWLKYSANPYWNPKTFLDFHDEHLWNELMYRTNVRQRLVVHNKCDPPIYLNEVLAQDQKKVQDLIDLRMTDAGQFAKDQLLRSWLESI